MDAYAHTGVETNGIRLHVVTAGDPRGKPVVLLHGFPEFWYGWRHQIPALVSAGCRVIVPDQRGYNLSDKPAGVRAYRMDELGRDILGLLDHFGYDQVSLAGHDWGAAVAWWVALTFPRRVERLAILNVPHPSVMLEFLRRSPRQMLKSWYIAFFQIPGLADWTLRRNDCALAARLLAGSGRRGTFTREDIEAYKQAWSQPGALTAMINWYRALLRHRPSMPGDVRLNMPVLVLWGKRDVALSQEMAQRSVELCDQGRLVYFENASHWVQHDEADEVNRLLIAFTKET